MREMMELILIGLAGLILVLPFLFAVVGIEMSRDREMDRWY